MIYTKCMKIPRHTMPSYMRADFIFIYKNIVIINCHCKVIIHVIALIITYIFFYCSFNYRNYSDLRLLALLYVPRRSKTSAIICLTWSLSTTLLNISIASILNNFLKSSIHTVLGLPLSIYFTWQFVSKEAAYYYGSHLMAKLER